MKCFECGSLCKTEYYQNPDIQVCAVTHVSKVCINCGWESFKTKVPEAI